MYHDVQHYKPVPARSAWATKPHQGLSDERVAETEDAIRQMWSGPGGPISLVVRRPSSSSSSSVLVNGEREVSGWPSPRGCALLADWGLGLRLVKWMEQSRGPLLLQCTRSLVLRG
ncbi:hypothetical protein CMUS01_00152 [Colletotrichum musicola]|uniref:Uncharacterized protein n=1 Tax=Colletotrichum musicola TaxID=2175873 RepID=A0A8H6U9Y1_9PEZI|nr:hypothetical protein CMUS01_00152 [Colletotrichum musicola]